MSKTVNIAYRKFIAQYPHLYEEAEQLAGRYEFEDGKKRDVAESMTMLQLKDKYNLWGGERVQ